MESPSHRQFSESSRFARANYIMKSTVILHLHSEPRGKEPSEALVSFDSVQASPWFTHLSARMRQAAAMSSELAVGAGLRHFLKVTRSYRPGLFHRYDSAELPRTNNDLEKAFGSHRYHERCASGQRGASPSLAVMGSARVTLGLAIQQRPEEGLALRTGSVEWWQELLSKLDRQKARWQQRRLHHDPSAYLEQLEQQCLQLTVAP